MIGGLDGRSLRFHPWVLDATQNGEPIFMISKQFLKMMIKDHRLNTPLATR